MMKKMIRKFPFVLSSYSIENDSTRNTEISIIPRRPESTTYHTRAERGEERGEERREGERYRKFLLQLERIHPFLAWKPA